METINPKSLKQRLRRVVYYLEICSTPRLHVVSSWYNVDLNYPDCILSNICSSGAEVMKCGKNLWFRSFNRTLPFSDLPIKDTVGRIILGLFLIFNSAFGLFCIDIASEKRVGPDAEFISFDWEEIPIVGDSVKLQQTSAYRVPFILRRNLILIETKVEEKKGIMLLDSGMDHVVLNQKYFKGLPDADNIIGVMDDRGYTQRKYVSMKIGHLPAHSQFALIADLNHLEQIFHVEILGICGVDYLQQFQWVIHYPQRFIDFYPLGKSGAALNHSLSPPNEVLELQKEAHLLIVKAQSVGHTMNLVLDTGTNSTILDKKNKAFLIGPHGNLEQLQHTTSVTGINGKRKLINSFGLSDLFVGSTVIPPLQISFLSLKEIRSRGNINLDGIFNPIFLSHSIIGINWKKKRLYLWQYIPKSQESVAGNLDQ